MSYRETTKHEISDFKTEPLKEFGKQMHFLNCIITATEVSDSSLERRTDEDAFPKFAKSGSGLEDYIVVKMAECFSRWSLQTTLERTLVLQIYSEGTASYSADLKNVETMHSRPFFCSRDNILCTANKKLKTVENCKKLLLNARSQCHSALQKRFLSFASK